MIQKVFVQEPGQPSRVIVSTKVKQSRVVIAAPAAMETLGPVAEPTIVAFGCAPTKAQLWVTVPPVGSTVEE